MARRADTTERFTEQERAARKERAAEMRAEVKRGKNQAAGEKASHDEIAEMPEPGRRRVLAQRLIDHRVERRGGGGAAPAGVEGGQLGRRPISCAE